jgi:hypothetical protein
MLFAFAASQPVYDGRPYSSEEIAKSLFTPCTSCVVYNVFAGPRMLA